MNSVSFIKQLSDFLRAENYGKIAVIVGRYYAMDRDKRWERMQIAYEAMVAAKGEKITEENIIEVPNSFSLLTMRIYYNNFQQYIKTKCYPTGETDEFLKPIVLNEAGCVKGMFCWRLSCTISL